MAYKIGDCVKIIQRKKYNKTGLVDFNKENGDVGVVAYINRKSYNLEDRTFNYEVWDKGGQLYYGWFDEDDIEPYSEKSYKDNFFEKYNQHGTYMVIDPAVYYKPNDSTEVKKDGTNIMSKALKYVKDKLLSEDEKLLRKYGLKDDSGEFTQEAEEIVSKKILNDNLNYLIEIARGLDNEAKELNK